MNFITERRNIHAEFAILNGNLAFENKQMVNGKVAHVEMATPCLAILNDAFKALEEVKQKLEDYYKKHTHLGRIVKFFDHHKIFGRFGKKTVVDTLIKNLAAKILVVEAEDQKAEAIRKEQEKQAHEDLMKLKREQPKKQPPALPPRKPRAARPKAHPKGRPAAAKAKDMSDDAIIEQILREGPPAARPFNAKDLAKAKGNLKPPKE